MSKRRTMLASVVGAAVALGGLAASTTASADVACNRFNECWHVHERYTTYPADVGVVFYDEDWAKAHRHGYHWFKDRADDHGYWAHGHWTDFPH
jgi:hypothetical protein